MENLFKNLQGCFGNKTGGCGWNEISFFAENILQAIIYVGLFCAACMVGYAGWLLIRKGGSQDARSRVKKIFKNIVLGLILLFGAYFIVDLVLTQLGVAPEFREGFVEPSGSAK